ncbi:hypothetical protein COO60DRAFT_1521752, partial [Scenedesmus sp. NREL 46B-D3]
TPSLECPRSLCTKAPARWRILRAPASTCCARCCSSTPARRWLCACSCSCRRSCSSCWRWSWRGIRTCCTRWCSSMRGRCCSCSRSWRCSISSCSTRGGCQRWQPHVLQQRRRCCCCPACTPVAAHNIVAAAATALGVAGGALACSARSCCKWLSGSCSRSWRCRRG